MVLTDIALFNVLGHDTFGLNLLISQSLPSAQIIHTKQKLNHGETVHSIELLICLLLYNF